LPLPQVHGSSGLGFLPFLPQHGIFDHIIPLREVFLKINVFPHLVNPSSVNSTSAYNLTKSNNNAIIFIHLVNPSSVNSTSAYNLTKSNNNTIIFMGRVERKGQYIRKIISKDL